MRFPGLLFPAFLAAYGLAIAQSPHFEVASIRPFDPNAKRSSLWSDHGALNATNQTIRDLITTAWHIRDFQLTGGPAWVSSDRYGILAKPRLMDRFRLVIHKEMREAQVYLLTVAKGGPKLSEATTPGDKQGITMNARRMQGFVAPLQMLAENLSSAAGRPVIDKTGLTAKYN